MDMHRTIAAAGCVVLLAAAITGAEAQVRKPATTTTGTTATVGNITIANVYRYYGKIKQLQGTKALASAATAGQPDVGFTVPSTVPTNQVLPGQPVYLLTDMTKARFTKFPISVPNSETTVGRGAGQGRFVVRTKNVVMGANGLITGEAKINSEDFISGFTGVVWLRFFDKDGNPVHVVRAGCWGVNLRQGRDEVWQKQVPAEAALVTRKVEVMAGNTGCGRDRFDEAMEDLKKAAEAAGAWVEVYNDMQGGGVAGGTGGTSPTTPQRP